MKDREEGIAYQNKDIASKALAEYLKGKTFQVYGLKLPEIRQVLPTNIPAVRANELRLDNLFELADKTVAIVDYESEYKKEDKVKYLNYLAGIANRYLAEKKPCPTLRMIVIYTGDIKRKQVAACYDAGAFRVTVEPAFLSELDSGGIFRHLKRKVENHERLTDKELMELIILPLSYRKKEEKEKQIRGAVGLATQIQDRGQQIFALSGILVFADKVIDAETAGRIRKEIEMTQVARIFEEEKREAVTQALTQAAKAHEEEKLQALTQALMQAAKTHEEEKREALTQAAKTHEEEKREALTQAAEAHEEEKLQIVIRMIQKNYPTEEISFMMPGFSLDAIEAIRKEALLKKN